MKLINRLAWMASMSAGFVLSYFLFYGDRYLPVIIMGFFTIVFGAVFKKAFLSKEMVRDYIEKGGRMEIKEADAKAQTFFEKIMPLETVENPPKEEPALEEENEIKTPTDLLSAMDAAETGNEFFVTDEEDGNAKKREVKPEDQVPNFMEKFFAENALAKIGGIILFLGVLFLLKLVYTVIGPIGKLMLGFSIGILLFAVGAILDDKGYKKEARIVIGTSILINYLVILAGRYQIEESSYAGKTILNEGITFFFLIVNTLFAIIASLAYRSNPLLFFAFAVSYLNPLLINAAPVLTPYTLVGYSMLVSLGALATAYVISAKDRKIAISLVQLAFWGGNFLFLLAPFTESYDWIIKLGCFAALSFLCILYMYKKEETNFIWAYFASAYLFFFFLLISADYKLGAGFQGPEVFFSYTLASFALMGFTLFVLIYKTISSFFYILFAPLALFLMLILFDMASAGQAIILLCLTMAVYVAVFSVIYEKVEAVWHYLYFGALGAFGLLSVGYISRIFDIFLTTQEMDWFRVGGVIFASFFFILSAYYFSSKKNLEFLYSFGSILGIFMLLPIIRRDGEFMMASIISVSVFMLLNLLAPFINRRLPRADIKNLIIGVIAGALFAVSQIFYFLRGDQDYSQMTLGFSFMALAVIYFFITNAVYSKIRYSEKEEAQPPISGNVFYAYAGISVSLFSLAVAYIFADNPGAVAVIWMFEACLIYYFFQSSKDKILFYFASVLFIIGLFKIFFGLPDRISEGEYGNLITVFFVFISLAYSLKFIETEKSNLRWLHDAAHAVVIMLLSLMISKVVPHEHGLFIFALSVFSLLLYFLYSSVYSGISKYVLPAFLFIVYLAQILILGDLFSGLENRDLQIFKIFQYAATATFAIGYLFFDRSGRILYEKNQINKHFYAILKIISSIYLFIITTQYVYLLMDKNVFVISIYWGIIAFIFLTKGINKDIIGQRTIGLYILALAVAKVILHDIWTGLDDAVMRVIALMAIGGIMIAISILYSRKYGSRLKGEFALENLFDKTELEILRK
jgi:MFS family permease